MKNELETAAADTVNTFNVLLQKLGEVAPGAWEGLVDYYRTKALISLCAGPVFLVLAVTMAYAFFKTIEKEDARQEKQGGTEPAFTVFKMVVFGVFGGFCTLGVLVQLITLQEDIATFNYPEKAAAEALADMLGDLK